MSLIAKEPLRPNETGLRAKSIKPITEQGLMVTTDEQPQPTSKIWDALDSLGATTLNGVGTALQGLVNRELNRQNLNPETPKVTTQGKPTDQAGNVVSAVEKEQQKDFFNKHKTPLMIGAGVLGVGILILLVR